MATLSDILANRDLADDVTVRIGDGEVSLGELRKGAMLQSDYTRKTQELSETRKKFEQEKRASEAQLQEWAAALLTASNVPARDEYQPLPEPDEVDRILEKDPVARRLTEQIGQLASVVETMHERERRLEEQLKQKELAEYENQHKRVLAQLKKSDPDLNDTELIDYARKNYVPRLDVAYRAMTYEKAMEKAREEGKQLGIKEGQETARRTEQPLIPRTRGMIPTLPSENKSADLNEALQKAVVDPEIQKIVYGPEP